MHKYLSLLFILMFICPASCLAWQVTLGWDANTEPELVGYKVYYNTSPGYPYHGTEADQGTSPITILCKDLPNPNGPEFTLTGLISGYRYYFAVTAFSDDKESGHSNEVSTEEEDAKSGSARHSDSGGDKGCFISTLGGHHDSK